MKNIALVSGAHHPDSDSTDVFGFWLYILTDCILFGCLFATFLVLIETFLLLVSNLTFCLASLTIYKNKPHKAQIWLFITFLLGLGFVFMEVNEFIHMANEGFRWDVSGAISSFFVLVGTHGLHVTCGLLWILLMIIQIFFIKSHQVTQRRMIYLGMFWNFLDIVWIFVFTIVYLMGAI